MRITKIFFLLSSLVVLPVMAEAGIERHPDGVEIVAVGKEELVNRMAIYPADGISDRPLLVMIHGSGGSGPDEIKGWIYLARQHRFTIVCPTLLSPVHSMHIPEDRPFFDDCLHWIGAHLRYDRRNVFMSGVSGGGFAVWYLGASRPDIFRGLFLQSGNFAGDYYGLDLSRWRDKPIRLIWGSEDLPDIPVQNQQAVSFLKSSGCKNYSFEVIPGGHHGEHPDMLVAWMEKQISP